MRKSVLVAVLAFSALCANPSWAGLDADSHAASEQWREGTTQASSSASWPDSRMYEDLPPLAQDTTVNYSDSHAAKKSVPAQQQTGASSQVKNYVWLK